MTAPLAAIFEFVCQSGIEEHHRFRRQGPALVAPKDSTSTPHFQVLRLRTAQMRHGIGEAGAVHVQLQAMVMGKGTIAAVSPGV